jgi:hypothetical protein
MVWIGMGIARVSFLLARTNLAVARSLFLAKRHVLKLKLGLVACRSTSERVDELFINIEICVEVFKMPVPAPSGGGMTGPSTLDKRKEMAMLWCEQLLTRCS